MKLGGTGGGEARGACRSCDDGTAAGPAHDDGTADAAANDVSRCPRWCPDVHGLGLDRVADWTTCTTATREGQTQHEQIGFSSDFQ